MDFKSERISKTLPGIMIGDDMKRQQSKRLGAKLRMTEADIKIVNMSMPLESNMLWKRKQ